MRKIGIIGMGHVGATVAFSLFTHGIADELVLIDKNEDKVSAEYNDLHDTLARNNYYVNVRMQDWDALKDADVVYFCYFSYCFDWLNCSYFIICKHYTY